MKKVIYVALFAFAINASAQEEFWIANGFSTGEQFLSMSETEKSAFSMGTVNGMLLAPLFGAPKEQMLRIETCLVGMTNSQVTAIFEKYLRDNPSRWHQTPHVPMYSALIQACPE